MAGSCRQPPGKCLAVEIEVNERGIVPTAQQGAAVASLERRTGDGDAGLQHAAPAYLGGDRCKPPPELPENLDSLA